VKTMLKLYTIYPLSNILDEFCW